MAVIRDPVGNTWICFSVVRDIVPQPPGEDAVRAAMGESPLQSRGVCQMSPTGSHESHIDVEYHDEQYREDDESERVATTPHLAHDPHTPPELIFLFWIIEAWLVGKMSDTNLFAGYEQPHRINPHSSSRIEILEPPLIGYVPAERL